MNRLDRLYEQVLVLRCRTGDSAAFEELVARHHARLSYYLGRMLPRPEIADDVEQDVWFDVFRSIGRLSDARAFRSWLYRIARIRVYRWWRKHRPVQPLNEPQQIEDVGEADGFPAEEAERIHAALRELTPEHREVLILRYVDGMSYEQIVEVVECAAGTVRSRLHYAKAALRRLLESEDEHE